MWPDRVSNPGPVTYESGALPIALRGPAKKERNDQELMQSHPSIPKGKEGHTQSLTNAHERHVQLRVHHNTKWVGNGLKLNWGKFRECW